MLAVQRGARIQGPAVPDMSWHRDIAGRGSQTNRRREQDVNTAEILDRAADEMERRGKATHGYCDAAGRVCVIGAIAAIHGIAIDCGAMADWDSRCRETPEWRTKLMDAFGGGVTIWSDANDAPTVIAGLRAVAATLRAQEQVAITPETVAA